MLHACYICPSSQGDVEVTVDVYDNDFFFDDFIDDFEVSPPTDPEGVTLEGRCVSFVGEQERI